MEKSSDSLQFHLSNWLSSLEDENVINYVSDYPTQTIEDSVTIHDGITPRNKLSIPMLALLADSSTIPPICEDVKCIPDTGCTTMIISQVVARRFNLPIQLLLDPFTKGATANITQGVIGDKSFVWNFIAVSDNISTILIDIKQPVPAGYRFLADEQGASLIQSVPPYDVVLYGKVCPNRSYQWDFS